MVLQNVKNILKYLKRVHPSKTSARLISTNPGSRLLSQNGTDIHFPYEMTEDFRSSRHVNEQNRIQVKFGLAEKHKQCVGLLASLPRLALSRSRTSMIERRLLTGGEPRSADCLPFYEVLYRDTICFALCSKNFDKLSRLCGYLFFFRIFLLLRITCIDALTLNILSLLAKCGDITPSAFLNSRL